MDDKMLVGREVNMNGLVITDISFPQDTAEAVGKRAGYLHDAEFTPDGAFGNGQGTIGNPDDARFLLEQIKSIEERLAQREPVSLLTSVRNFLSWRRTGFPSRPTRVNQASRSYSDARLPETTQNNNADVIPEDEDFRHLWNRPTLLADAGSSSGQLYITPISLSEQLGQTTIHTDQEVCIEVPESKPKSGSLKSLHEGIRRHRLAVGMGTLIVAGCIAFAATSLDKGEHTGTHTNVEAQVAMPSRNNPSVFSMPTDRHATLQLPPTQPEVPNPAPATDVQAPELVTFTISKYGNLTWSVREQLQSRGYSEETAAEHVAAAIQSRTDRDLNTVYAGEEFSVQASELAALANAA